MKKYIYVEEELYGRITKSEIIHMLGAERDIIYGRNGEWITIHRDDMENINAGITNANKEDIGNGCYLELCEVE